MSARILSWAKWSTLNLRTASRSCACSSVNLYSPWISATGNLLPRHARIGTQIAGQSENALAEDVAHHLRRAAFDGVRTAAQVLLLDGTLPVALAGGRPLRVPAV